ncbi:hypothetical protein C7N43_39635 [Sphingobacteriales bacterium UPWRP_1]|nr:hypothetical protein C7N43_39635 [Sphingobacteriales bacterium UPWRP_1]
MATKIANCNLTIRIPKSCLEGENIAFDEQCFSDKLYSVVISGSCTYNNLKINACGNTRQITVPLCEENEEQPNHPPLGWNTAGVFNDQNECLFETAVFIFEKIEVACPGNPIC